MQYRQILSFALAVVATATGVAAGGPFVEASTSYIVPPYLFYKVNGSISSYQYMGVNGIFARVFTRDLPDTSRCLSFEPPLSIEELASRLEAWVDQNEHDNCLLAVAPPDGDLEGQSLETMGVTFDSLQASWALAQERVMSEEFQNAIKGSPLDTVHEDDLAITIMMALPSEKERLFWLFIPLLDGFTQALEEEQRLQDAWEEYQHYEDTVNQQSVTPGEAPAPGAEHMGDYIQRPDGIWETLDASGDGLVVEVENGMKIRLNKDEPMPRWVQEKWECKTPLCAYEYTE